MLFTFYFTFNKHTHCLYATTKRRCRSVGWRPNVLNSTNRIHVSCSYTQNENSDAYLETIQAAQKETDPKRQYTILHVGMALIAKIKEILKETITNKTLFTDREK